MRSTLLAVVGCLGMLAVLAQGAGCGSSSFLVDGGCATAIAPVAPQPGDPPNLVRLSIAYSSCNWGNGLTPSGQSAQTLSLIADGGGASDIDARTTYTFSGGATLATHFTGTGSAFTFNPDHTYNVSFTGTEAVTGGTGTYANATGSIGLTGTASGNPATFVGTGVVQQKGTVNY